MRPKPRLRRFCDLGPAWSCGRTSRLALTQPNDFDAALANEIRAIVRAVLAGLSPRERTVILLRFGIADGRVRTLVEVGQALGGLTHERVRQIERDALDRLRQLRWKLAGLVSA
jgi:RNA polymerase sigma factor (sigma-70 family)